MRERYLCEHGHERYSTLEGIPPEICTICGTKNLRKEGKMKRVVIESPYKGDDKQMQINEIYGEFAMHDCLVNHNESPYASHLLYTRKHVLRDWVPEERKLGIEAGFYWRDVSEQSNFYVDLGITDGMGLGIDDCNEKGKYYELRSLPDELWKEFENVCLSGGLGKPKRELLGGDSL